MRETYIDYGKAIFIIMVISVHAGLSSIDSWSYVRMIFFFFVTGYTYTIGKRSLADGIKRRFTGIMPSFWKLILFNVVLDIIRAEYLGYDDYNIAKADVMFGLYGANLVPKAVPFSDFFMNEAISPKNLPFAYSVITPLNCHLWFLAAMFSGCVLFFIYVEKIRRNKFYDIPVILLMLYIASLESLNTFQLPFSIGRGCLACACMIAAVNIKELRLISHAAMKRKIICGLIALCVFVFTYLNGSYKCSFIISFYGDGTVFSVLMTYLGGVSAAVLFLYLMQILEHYYKSPTLEFIGRNTMTLYLWNMIFNTIFSILLLKITGNEVVLDEFNMALLPGNSYLFIFITVLLTVITGTVNYPSL